MPVDDNAGLFETLLLALERSSAVPGPLRETDDELQHPAATPMQDDLQLVAALRNYRLPEHETNAARERVFAQLAGTLADADASARAISGREARRPHAARRNRAGGWRRKSRVAAAIAALLAIGMLGGWQVSSAAAAANPDSPLYSVKRLEERVALATAWSDSRRGEVLMTIADHRLSEMLYESREHDQTRVRGLAVEYNSTMRSLINLTVTMQRQHEDVQAVLADLSHALNLESQAARSALTSGDVTLSLSLASAINGQSSAIRAGNLDIAAPTLGAPPNQSIPAGATPSATSPKRGASQPPRQNTPGASQSGKNGGNGNGGASGSSGSGHKGSSGSGGSNTHQSSGGGASGNSRSSDNGADRKSGSGTSSSTGGTGSASPDAGASGSGRAGTQNSRVSVNASTKGSSSASRPPAVRTSGASATTRARTASATAKPAAKAPDAEPEPSSHDTGH